VHGAWKASVVYVWVMPYNLKPSLRERYSLPAHCVGFAHGVLQGNTTACCYVLLRNFPELLEVAATRALSAHAHHPSLSCWLGSVAICVTVRMGLPRLQLPMFVVLGVWHCGVGRWFGGVIPPLSGTILGFAAGQSEADTLADRRDSGTYCSLQHRPAAATGILANL
jgi:hypothetical protein